MRSKKEFTTDYSGKLYRKMTDPVLTTYPSFWINYTLNYCRHTILLSNIQKYPKITPRSTGATPEYSDNFYTIYTDL